MRRPQRELGNATSIFIYIKCSKSHLKFAIFHMFLREDETRSAAVKVLPPVWKMAPVNTESSN